MVDISKVYSLIEEIEENNEYIFVVYDKTKEIGIDVLDYESEEYIDGSWFSTVGEVLEYLNEFK